MKSKHAAKPFKHPNGDCWSTEGRSELFPSVHCATVCGITKSVRAVACFTFRTEISGGEHKTGFGFQSVHSSLDLHITWLSA
jgi:hypothetical protein